MKMMAIMIVFVFSFQVALAEDCSYFKNRSVDALNFEEAVARMPKNIPEKGEFEKMGDFKKRVLGLSEQLIFVKKEFEKAPDGKEPYFYYDADRGILKISKYAVYNSIPTFDERDGLERFSGEYPEYNHNIHKIGTVVGQKTIYEGEFIGKNAFGQRARVKKFRKITSSIFQGSYADSTTSIFDRTIEGAEYLEVIPMSVEHDRLLRQNAQLVIAVRPKFPFLLNEKEVGRQQPSVTLIL